jgi:hypothetical protein
MIWPNANKIKAFSKVDEFVGFCGSLPKICNTINFLADFEEKMSG